MRTVLLCIVALITINLSAQDRKTQVTDSLLAAEQQKLREYAFCKFLSKSASEWRDKIVKDGSVGGYFHTSDYNPDTFASIDSLVDLKRKEITLKSKYNRPLLFMKAFRFYNDPSLKRLIEEAKINEGYLNDRVNKILNN